MIRDRILALGPTIKPFWSAIIQYFRKDLSDFAWISVGVIIASFCSYAIPPTQYIKKRLKT